MDRPCQKIPTTASFNQFAKMIDFSKAIGNAWDRSEELLFRPFDLNKWLVLGFCAWLASYMGAGYSSGRYGNYAGHQNGKSGYDINQFKHSIHDFLQHTLGPEWKVILVALIVILVLVLLLLTLLLAWLGARGQFMLLDNLVQRRFKVAQPWCEQGALADRFFFFYLVFLMLWIGFVLLLVGGSLLICWPYLWQHKPWSWWSLPPLLAIFLVFIGSVIIVGVFFRLLLEFGIPIMYRTRCGTREACRRVWKLMTTHPLDCFVYLLVRLVIGVVSVLLALLAGCCTCCIGFLPYVHSVITLPLPVFRIYFTLDCLARLDPEYDLWSLAGDERQQVI